MTGTLTAGQLQVDDRVEVFPGGAQAKIRGLQVHGRPVERAVAGQRTAVNLQSLERAAIDRGNVLGLAGSLVPSGLVDGTLELLEEAPRPLKSRDRVRFHTGTAEVMARVLLLDRAELAPGESAFVRVRLEQPVVAMPRDRFVVRSYSPVVTIGGGRSSTSTRRGSGARPRRSWRISPCSRRAATRTWSRSMCASRGRPARG